MELSKHYKAHFIHTIGSKNTLKTRELEKNNTDADVLTLTVKEKKSSFVKEGQNVEIGDGSNGIHFSRTIEGTYKPSFLGE